MGIGVFIRRLPIIDYIFSLKMTPDVGQTDVFIPEENARLISFKNIFNSPSIIHCLYFITFMLHIMFAFSCSDIA